MKGANASELDEMLEVPADDGIGTRDGSERDVERIDA